MSDILKKSSKKENKSDLEIDKYFEENISDDIFSLENNEYKIEKDRKSVV